MITSNDNTILIRVSTDHARRASYKCFHACIDVDEDTDDDWADYDIGLSYIGGQSRGHRLVVHIQLSGTGFFTPDTGGGIII